MHNLYYFTYQIFYLSLMIINGISEIYDNFLVYEKHFQYYLTYNYIIYLNNQIYLLRFSLLFNNNLQLNHIFLYYHKQ